MARSNWARKPGPEMVLAIRQGREEALSQAVLTHAASITPDYEGRLGVAGVSRSARTPPPDVAPTSMLE